MFSTFQTPVVYNLSADKPFITSSDLFEAYTSLHMDSKTALLNGTFGLLVLMKKFYVVLLYYFILFKSATRKHMFCIYFNYIIQGFYSVREVRKFIRGSGKVREIRDFYFKVRVKSGGNNLSI